MRIPIKLAKQVSKEIGFAEIVIFGYDPHTGTQHVTTYGKTLSQCIDAARAGNFLKKSLGWPDEMCNAKPARMKNKEKMQ
jgi:hypothetical protein